VFVILNELLIAVPVVLAILVGFGTRNASDPFAFTSYDPLQNRILEAYAPYVAETQMAIANPVTADSARTRALAQEWVQGADKGELKTPNIVSWDDNVDNAAKQQVFTASYRIVEALNVIAEREARSGQWDLAARDSFLSLDMAAVTRDFDLISITRMTGVERRSLACLRETLPHLSQSHRHQLIERLSEVPIRHEKLLAIAIRSRDVFSIDQAQMHQFSGPSIGVDAQLPISSLSRLSTAGDDKRLRQLVNKESDNSKAEFYGLERAAFHSSADIERDVQDMLAGIQKNRRS
jgi:hypothetical protein